MCRRLFTLCSALSFLLCVAVCSLWLGGEFGVWRLRFQFWGGAYELRSSSSTIRLSNDYVTEDWDERYQAVLSTSNQTYRRLEAVETRLRELRAKERRTRLAPGEGKERSALESEARKAFDIVRPPPRLPLARGRRMSWVVYHPVLGVGLSFLPILWCMRLRDQRRILQRVALGLCPSCGYDLRATPERCPECGMVHGDVNVAI